ncbi:MAG: hypothetical protein ACYS9X_05800 [Planctomycetota bacterium]
MDFPCGNERGQGCWERGRATLRRMPGLGLARVALSLLERAVSIL